jgi:hypothetical protein
MKWSHIHSVGVLRDRFISDDDEDRYTDFTTNETSAESYSDIYDTIQTPDSDSILLVFKTKVHGYIVTLRICTLRSRT